MEAITISKLSKIYKGKRGGKVEAITDLSLEIHEGEVFGFLGPNGAGKSTTIKSIIGQVRPTSGQVAIFDVAASETSARRRVGYLPENPAFYDVLTAREYLFFVGRIFSMPEADITKRASEVLELLDLIQAADRPIRSYSKGMVQRLGFAQAMLHDPDLYILDEPMSGLDPIGRVLVKNIIKSLKQKGKTVFFSTHITSDIEVVCDRVGIIVGGQLRALNSVQHVVQSGIEGYTLQIVKGSAMEEVYVEHVALQAYLAEAVASGTTIERIEPQRKDMEAFFLDIVNRTHAS